MLIDFTEQPGPMSQPNLPAIAPPPPAVKPPTLATQLVQTVETEKRMARIERTLDMLLVAMCGVLLVIIAEAVMLGVLLGQGR